MIKKLICLILVFGFLISTIVFADTLSENKQYDETEAALVAMIFMVNNDEYGKSWNKDTYVETVYPQHDLEGNINSYYVSLRTKDKDSGYVVVSNNIDESPIIEYSLSSQNIYEVDCLKDKISNIEHFNVKLKEKDIVNGNTIVYLSPFDIYINKDNSLIDLKGNVVEKQNIRKIDRTLEKAVIRDNKELNKSLKQFISEFIDSNYMKTAEYDGQVSGYVIENYFLYMSDRYGSYTHISSKTLSNLYGFKISDYGYDNSCTLVAIGTVAHWYDTTYSNIPNNMQDIVDDIYSVASGNGYSESGGTNPLYIDNIAENSFSLWGYNVNASNTYVWSFSTFKNEINANRPLLFNITTGYYSSHTVTIKGYKQYDVANFLVVKDGWVLYDRYIHFDQMWNELGSVTKIQF